MKTAKAIIGTIGTSAFAVLLAVAVYYFTTQPRSEGALWWMAGSGVVCAVCVVVWLVFQARGEETVQAAPSVAAAIGKDNSGTQNSAGRDVNQTTHIHHYPAPPPAIPYIVEPANVIGAPPASTPPPQAPAVPALRIRRAWERVLYDAPLTQWRLGDEGEPRTTKAVVLWVANPYPTQGEGRELTNLIASVEATQFDSSTIPRVYWIGKTYNEVNLTSGDELGVVVGHFEGEDKFILYANSYMPPTVYDTYGIKVLGRRAEVEIVLRDADTVPLTVTVTLAQVQGTRQKVIACRRLIIKLPARTMDIQDC